MRAEFTPKAAGRVLIIGNCPTTDEIFTSLKVGAYSVRRAAESRSALRLVHSFRPDVIIVDVAGPATRSVTIPAPSAAPPRLVSRGMAHLAPPDQVAMCALLRAVVPTPILTIGPESDRNLLVWTLDQGADDFIVWPSTQVELLVRTRALLRWSEPSHLREHQSIIRLGTVQIDLDARSVARHGRVVNLSPTEFDLLIALLRHYGRVAPRRSLLNEVWGSNATGCEHYLRLYVGYLRRKIEEDPHSPRLILNERGVGYRLAQAAITGP